MANNYFIKLLYSCLWAYVWCMPNFVPYFACHLFGTSNDVYTGNKFDRNSFQYIPT